LRSLTACDWRNDSQSSPIDPELAVEKAFFVSGKACSSISIEFACSFVREHVFQRPHADPYRRNRSGFEKCA
jgi:hypothetical protein